MHTLKAQKKRREPKTLDLWRMKSVAVLALFVVIMATATVYSNYREALADTNTQPPEPECTIYFNPETPDVAVGETFTVTLMVDDVNNLWGYEIGLRFDRSVIEYVGAKTPHWRFISGTHPNPVMEHLFWVAGTNPQNGEVELMEFTFKAKAEGNSPLSLYVHKLATLKYWECAGAKVGWPITHDLAEGLVTVS